MPTGECIDTGFSRFDGAKTGPLSRWGVGPSLDGLFSQSNFGIVTLSQSNIPRQVQLGLKLNF